MERLRYEGPNAMPVCPWCRKHAETEHWRGLWDSFGAVKRADPTVSIKALRHAYFEAFHDRGHTKTEEWAELDGELIDY